MPQKVSSINPADFVPVIDNAYFPLAPGTTYITETPDGSLVDTFAVTRQTRVIDGVTCVVVSDIARQDGEIIEKTSDFFAQDKNGNVWYFGEQTAEYEDGKVVSTEGSWLAGVDNAAPGIIMEAAPKVGDSYDQENAPGVAEDHAAVIGLNRSVNVPYGAFDHALVTHETSGLEPSASENKVYVKGIGFVQAVDLVTGEVEQLVKIKQDGTSHADTLTGHAGTDELNGRAGNDRLDGAGGSDVVNGGSGNDRLDGGKDHVADILNGGDGDDRITVRAGDQAHGGAGNDLFLLLDDSHLGVIDGGGHGNVDLAHSQGDRLRFTGALDLTAPGLAGHVTGIETISMRNGHGGDALTLDAQDVLDLGSGSFDPACHGGHDPGPGDAVRINGNCGDRLNLAGCGWTEIEARNAPDGYDVYAAPTAHGTANVLVQEAVHVHID
jgi:Ca2+-binding RTX toxin-like protein